MKYNPPVVEDNTTTVVKDAIRRIRNFTSGMFLVGMINLMAWAGILTIIGIMAMPEALHSCEVIDSWISGTNETLCRPNLRVMAHFEDPYRRTAASYYATVEYDLDTYEYAVTFLNTYKKGTIKPCRLIPTMTPRIKEFDGRTLSLSGSPGGFIALMIIGSIAGTLSLFTVPITMTFGCNLQGSLMQLVNPALAHQGSSPAQDDTDCEARDYIKLQNHEIYTQ